MSLGFTDPIWVQYGRFVKGIFVGADYDTGPTTEHCPAPCLGYSFVTQNPVLPDLLDRLPVTISLAAGAAMLWLVAGVTTACCPRCRRGSMFDRAAMGVALAGVSLPIFFTGLLCLSIFSYSLGITAPGGTNPMERRTRRSGPMTCSCPGSRWHSSTPRRTPGSPARACSRRWSEDFIRTARAKGLPERTVVVKHGLRATLTPILTIFGLDLGLLLGGAILTENTFSLPASGSTRGRDRQQRPAEGARA